LTGLRQKKGEERKERGKGKDSGSREKFPHLPSSPKGANVESFLSTVAEMKGGEGEKRERRRKKKKGGR